YRSRSHHLLILLPSLPPSLKTSWTPTRSGCLLLILLPDFPHRPHCLRALDKRSRQHLRRLLGKGRSARRVKLLPWHFQPRNHRAPSTGTTQVTGMVVVGHVYFLSSGQLYVNNNQGIYDQVLIDLHNIAAPSPGKSYYAWLLGDSNQSDVPWISLGKVSVNQ